MPRYLNKHGDSPIIAYESGPTWILVRYQDGRVYRYTNASTGTTHVRAMKRLAEAGEGLSTYISQQVRERYQEKRDR